MFEFFKNRKKNIDDETNELKKFIDENMKDHSGDFKNMMNGDAEMEGITDEYTHLMDSILTLEELVIHTYAKTIATQALLIDKDIISKTEMMKYHNQILQSPDIKEMLDNNKEKRKMMEERMRIINDQL